MDFDFETLPEPKGKLLREAPLAPYTWFRVGGMADALFLPQDEEDLSIFLKALPGRVPVTILGVGSNTIVRDGGIEGVVIRLMGGYWGQVEIEGGQVSARAGALDLSVARAAAKAGVGGLSFLSGIPGSIGGAVRTNAGCYGYELSDVVTEVDGITRAGEAITLQRKDIGFSYRHTDFATNIVVTCLHLKGEPGGDPDMLAEDIAAHQK
ncbi:MAG: FAD-binding protein, partial [Pseudomonadota bacterium]